MEKKFIIDKEKNIGNVIFVVEGGNEKNVGTELKLIKSVFAGILGYEVHELRRGSNEFIGYGKNAYSKVYALNLPKNQLTELNGEALDNLFARIKKEFSLKPEDCPIFFIYDRDYLSYKPSELRSKYVMKYTDPYSDEYGNQGQLLLSYPSIEAYMLSCRTCDAFKKYFLLGKEAKAENNMHGICAEKIDKEEDLVNSVNEMNKAMENLGILNYDVDNLKETLLKIYDEEQKLLKAEHAFLLLSQFSMAMLELGIIVEE